MISELTMGFVGDLALCDCVENAFRECRADEGVERFRSVMSDCDVVIANLECALTDSANGQRGQAHLLRGSPSSAEYLTRLGIGAVSLANNHVMDFGEAGLHDTLVALAAVDVKTFGAGKAEQQARKPLIISRGGVRVALLGYCVKGTQSAGVAQCGAAVLDAAAIAEDVRAAKPLVDHVVVQVHSGLEFVDIPSPELRRTCKEAIEAGATAVIGHGPHVIQGLETFGEGVIAYSIGNFAFDRRRMDLETERSAEGIALKLHLDREKLVGYSTEFHNLAKNGIPIPVEDRDARRACYGRLESLSARLRVQDYVRQYNKEASETWSKINLRVNLRVLKQQGPLAFAKRLPRLKWRYVAMLGRFLSRRVVSLLRPGSSGAL